LFFDLTKYVKFKKQKVVPTCSGCFSNSLTLAARKKNEKLMEKFNEPSTSTGTVNARSEGRGIPVGATVGDGSRNLGPAFGRTAAVFGTSEINSSDHKVITICTKTTTL
jgi:hypothetical protein